MDWGSVNKGNLEYTDFDNKSRQKCFIRKTLRTETEVKFLKRRLLKYS